MLAIIRDLFRFNKEFRFGFIVIIVIITLAILSFFSPYNPKAWNQVPKDKPPSFKYLLGTTSVGQDVFWTLCFALKNSLTLGMVTALISITIGTAVGLIAGYRGGILDRVLMSLNDTFIVLPSFPILIFLAFTLRENLNVVTLGAILSMFSWPWGGRQVRSMILSLREREFTYAADFSGMGMLKIVFTEHFPFVFPWVVANFINTILWSIGMEVSLAVFGLSSLEMPTIGTMIYWANQYQALFRGIWWWILTPVIASVFLFVSFFFVSSAISEYLDPRTRLQRISVRG
ncbi:MULTISPECIES: ABC transporter permease [Thermotoga]|jgi:peptide/nickel transport system permease protein|uniref:Binding-protein-dependent transport systems inner membrane component n=3 Tax=Thermotogales TaxID=2419 RepID=D2C6U0_THEP2|nr:MULTISPECIES: ABC transporter permease [Thermotoga]KUK23096.1 MAG: Binding-protein-dependent transport systems inner membrane component [Thermotoga petrophila]ADA66676.1 binding-protein-dependent transport systems inner membrane component [Thermotoga petrophila RKU-10]AIY88304.1 binding-protein-dependent transport systems inner membrane component [Thermotoga sp. Cell2]KHC95900.1 binding-protein-dependent transport systems inner membrane component [Thermotoga sp. TBGT1765]KHC96022.1 binding-